MLPPTAAQEDRRLARRALNQADELLGELEELLLDGHDDIPSWCRHTAATARRAAINAGLRDPHFETEAGVIKLMDEVYTLEERLMRHLRSRTVRIAGRAVAQGSREHQHAHASRPVYRTVDFPSA